VLRVKIEYEDIGNEIEITKTQEFVSGKEVAMTSVLKMVHDALDEFKAAINALQ
jgi:hypothetical protein